MSPDLMMRLVDGVMSCAPKTIEPDALVGEALELMETGKITALFAVERRRPVGVVHMHDLLRIGLV
jgi:arabinose-5-phosphate isomerase